MLSLCRVSSGEEEDNGFKSVSNHDDQMRRPTRSSDSTEREIDPETPSPTHSLGEYSAE